MTFSDPGRINCLVWGDFGVEERQGTFPKIPIAGHFPGFRGKVARLANRVSPENPERIHRACKNICKLVGKPGALVHQCP
jgi:hypothetical protein